MGLGIFPDVAWHAGAWWVAWQHGDVLILVSLAPDTLAERSYTTISLGPGAGAFAKLLSWQGRLWLAYREGEPHERLRVREVGTSTAFDLGRAHGLQPALLARGYVYWQAAPTPTYRVRRRPLVGTAPDQDLRDGVPTGLSRVIADDQVRTVDEDFVHVPGLTKPSWAPGLVIGEHHDSTNRSAVARLLADGRELRLWRTQQAFTPRAAWDGGDRYLLTTWGAQGVPVAQVTVAEFRAPEADEPIEDSSGEPVDLWAYIIPDRALFPRTHAEPDGHAMDMQWDGRNLWTLPFGEPDHWIRWVIDGDHMTLREDHSRDGQGSGDYSFTHGPWLDRWMAPEKFGGHVIAPPVNYLVRYDPDGCRILDVHSHRYRCSLHRVWRHCDRGPALGWGPAIETKYDLGSMYELQHWAKDGGSYFRFQAIEASTGRVLIDKRFDERGGPRLEATPGCWKPEHLRLTPDNWQEDDVQKPGVQITRFDPVVRPGQPWRIEFHDRNNPAALEHCVVEFENGQVRVLIKNVADEDRSGPGRAVEVRCVE